MILSDLNGDIISSNNKKLAFDSALTVNLSNIEFNLNKTQLILIDGAYIN